MVKHNNKVHQLSGSCRLLSLPKIFAKQNILGPPSRAVTRSCFFFVLFISFNIIILPLITNSTNTSALTYQQGTDIEFTINPTISVSVSGDLTIDQLTPGDSSDSNIIDINVSTNNVLGYSLSATTGNTNNTTTDLKRSDNYNNKFTSLSTSDSLSSLTTDNTWGYSYSTNSGTNWSTYSGLPLYTATNGKELYYTNTNTSNTPIQFKIAAKASNIQASGNYTNTINFTALANPVPPKTMQEVSTWKNEIPNIGDSTQAVDTRDGNIYWVTRAADNQIWMTQNLDLCIGCAGTSTLTSNNTDLNTSGSGAYTNGYTVSGSVITWTPSGTTVTGAPATINEFRYTSEAVDGMVTGWSNTYNSPQMAEGGTEYLIGQTPYTDKADCMSNNSEEVCEHHHVGNYYNWTAAIASNASSSITEKYTVADNSICPKGWRLPKGPDGTNGSEFETMLQAAGIANPSRSDDGSGEDSVNVDYAGDGNLSNTNMEQSPYFFARSGYVRDTTLYYFTGYGYYWSSSAVSGSSAFNLSYSSSELYPADRNYRHYGWSLRCVAR